MTREQHVRAGIRLECIGLGWNALEAAVAIVSGVIAGSIALVGFGLDSVVETASGVALLWRLRADVDERRRVTAEARALKIVGWCFLALALYVLTDAAKSLYLRERPEESFPGIVIAALALVVMAWLARAKRRVAAGLDSAAMQADSRQAGICAYLSAILLGGLVLNGLLGWWWADPVAALVMVPIIAKEGADALRGKVCGCQGTCQSTTEEVDSGCRG